jgi:hypothetical protein
MVRYNESDRWAHLMGAVLLTALLLASSLAMLNDTVQVYIVYGTSIKIGSWPKDLVVWSEQRYRIIPNSKMKVF